MAIALCSPSNALLAITDGVNTGTWSSITIPSDCDFAVLLVSACASGVTNYLTAGPVPTLNDVGMTESPTVTDGSTLAWMGQMYYLAGPATGSGCHIDWDFSGTIDPLENSVSMILIFLKGVHQTDPIRSSGGEQQVGGTQYETGSIAGSSGDMAIITAWSFLGSDLNLTWTNGTEIVEQYDGLWIDTGAAYYSPSAATNYIMTTVGDDGGISALVLKPEPPDTAAITGTATASITEADIV